MNKLVKNELLKIFGKKSIYIMFVITFIFVVFTNILYKTQLDENGNFKKSTYKSSYLENSKKELKELNTNSPGNKNRELRLRKDIMKYELYEKYGEDSWQIYILENNMNDLIDELVSNKYGSEKNEELLLELEKKYNLYIEKFKKDDWKYFVNEEIEKVKKEKDDLDKYTEDPRYTEELLKDFRDHYDLKLEILNYRLKNNVSYSKSYLNTALKNYLDSTMDVKSADMDYIKEQDNIDPSGKLMHHYYQSLSKMNVNKYILDNKIDANKVNDTRGILINLFTEYELYIIVIIVMICAGIVADEFNKGTIKQLLLVPYSRIQILLSKFIACLLTLLFTIFIVILMQTIVGGITFGFSSLSIPVVVYNFNNNIIETYNVFHYLIIEILAKMPMFIILMMAVLLFSVITLNNAISVVFGMVLYLLTPVLNGIAVNSNIEALNFIVLLHWDFTKYLFGMISDNFYLNINMSIIICIIYFIEFVIPTFVIFKVKDIKNI